MISSYTDNSEKGADIDTSISVKSMNKLNWKKLLRTILSIALVATMILGCVSMLAGCNKESTSNSNDDNKGSSNKNEDKENNKEQYENLSDEEYMQKLEQNNIGEVLDAFTGIYGSLSTLDPNSSANLGAEVGISLQVGDYVLDMLQQSYEDSTGESMDFSFLSRVGLDMSTSIVDDMMGMELGVALANQKIISLNMLMNLSDSIMWFAVPELNDTYLEMNMGDMGMDMSSALGSLEDMPDIMSALPSEEQLSKLLTRYIELALANIKNVERTATTLELDGLKQDCTQMSVKLYQADAQAVLKAVASAALEDKDLQAIIENFTDFYNEMMRTQYEDMGYGWEWEDIDLYSDFTAMLEAMLEEMDVPEDDLDTENYIELVTYIDEDHIVIGRELKMPGADRAAGHYYTVTEGNAFAFEAVIEGTGFAITGSGTEKSGVIDGEYTLVVENTPMLVLELEDWTSNGMESVSGTIRLEPTAELMNSVFGGSSGMPFADVALEIKLDLDNEFYVELNLLGNDMLIVGIILEGKETSSDSLREPSNAIDMNDYEALQEWIADMDFDTIINNLRNAGVPSDLVDLLEDALDQAMNGGYAEPDYDYGYDWDDEF